MTVNKINPNTDICTINNLVVGDGFIKTNNDNERFYIIIAHNSGEGFYRCIDLKNGTENIFFEYVIVRKIDKIEI